MEAKHFFPNQAKTPNAMNPTEAGYENVKATFETSLDAIENCSTRCDAVTTMSTEPCMKKCFQKFFNSSLLIKKEWEQYTRIAK